MAEIPIWSDISIGMRNFRREICAHGWVVISAPKVILLALVHWFSTTISCRTNSNHILLSLLALPGSERLCKAFLDELKLVFLSYSHFLWCNFHHFTLLRFRLKSGTLPLEWLITSLRWLQLDFKIFLEKFFIAELLRSWFLGFGTITFCSGVRLVFLAVFKKELSPTIVLLTSNKVSSNEICRDLFIFLLSLDLLICLLFLFVDSWLINGLLFQLLEFISNSCHIRMLSNLRDIDGSHFT